MNIVLSNMRITNGYVDRFGLHWTVPTEAEVERAISGAMSIMGLSRDEVIAQLELGNTIRWCESPNFECDHSYGRLGTVTVRPQTRQVVRCACGHTCDKAQVMHASLGTSCPGCYDRMSN
jgi:hypothetical protein